MGNGDLESGQFIETSPMGRLLSPEVIVHGRFPVEMGLTPNH
jgi:hypothetical protein